MRLTHLLAAALLIVLSLSGPPSSAQSLNEFIEREEVQEQPKNYTISDYADMYFKGCRAKNESPELQDYVDYQCGCTSAKIPEFMNAHDMYLALGKDKEARFQRARIILNAYVPCLRETVKDYAYDQCLVTKQGEAPLNNKRGVCECISEGMAARAEERAEAILFGRNKANLELRNPDNLLASILTDRSYTVKYRYYTPKCLQQFEYNR